MELCEIIGYCAGIERTIAEIYASFAERWPQLPFGDLWRLVAGPDGRERREGDQVPHGAVKGSGFVGNCFGAGIKNGARPLWGTGRFAGNSGDRTKYPRDFSRLSLA
jgi:hypothetical protein